MSSARTEFSTPNIAYNDAVVFVKASVSIDAPAATVFRVLRNTDTWRDWNRFIPKVDITYQPPETDTVTAAEIQHLVRNTSIAGSFYSDLTDGGVGPQRPKSPDEQPPPRFRLNSISSQVSAESQKEYPSRMSESIDPGDASAAAQATANRRSMSSNEDRPLKSAAQRFAEAQETRRSSIASGKEPDPVQNKVLNDPDHVRASLSVPGSPSGKRRNSKQLHSVSSKAAERAYQSLMAVYGEPSVRLQVGTKLTLFCRMKPLSPSEYTETRVVVIDVSRPDDPITEQGTTALTRSKTHNLERSGKYRVVWATNSEGASLLNIGSILKGQKMPKSIIQAERVHEIEATSAGSCVYTNWELIKGHAAKTVKKKYEPHLQRMFDIWASGIKDFCEGLHAPKIATRDFSVPINEPPVVLQTVT